MLANDELFQNTMHLTSFKVRLITSNKLHIAMYVHDKVYINPSTLKDSLNLNCTEPCLYAFPLITATGIYDYTVLT